MSEWVLLRGGFLTGDVIRRRIPGWKKGRKKRYTGEGWGGSQLQRVGERSIELQVVGGPDEDGWVDLLIVQHDNLAGRPLDKIFSVPPVGKKVREKASIIMKWDAERKTWKDEALRERLLIEVWAERDAKYWLGNEEYEGEDA